MSTWRSFVAAWIVRLSPGWRTGSCPGRRVCTLHPRSRSTGRLILRYGGGVSIIAGHLFLFFVGVAEIEHHGLSQGQVRDAGKASRSEEHTYRLTSRFGM